MLKLINMEYLYYKIKELEIEHIYKYVMENNESKYLPYHNNFHLEQVCKYALLIADSMEIPFEDKKILAVASLFHDFNHSGGKFKDDSENISAAMKGFLEFNSWLKYMNYEPYSTNQKLLINKLINGTKYPYTSDGSDLPEIGKILRDSDTLQGLFCQNYVNGIIRALSTEIGIPFEKMLKGQIGFITGVKYLTEHANNISAGKIPEVIKLVENLISINE